MRFTLLSTASLLGIMIAGCGSKSEGEQQELIRLDPATEQALSQELSSLPENVLIKVQLDANGQEILDSATMVTVNGLITEETYAAALQSGSKVTDFIDGDNSLDDSSTASWFGWRRDGANNNRSFAGQRGLININFGGRYQQGTQQGAGIGAPVSVGPQAGGSHFNNFRPAHVAQAVPGGVFMFGAPTCFHGPSYRVYHYPRACHGFAYCDNVGRPGGFW